jgi:CRISPR-associated protein Csm3
MDSITSSAATSNNRERDMAILKQLETILLTGEIEVVSGLHIGAGSDTIEIGGMDNPIIKHPVSGAPYIPGSSLKGKLRSIVEWRLIPEKLMRSERDIKNPGKPGDPCACGLADCPSCVVFGVSAGDDLDLAKERGPTRLIVRDAYLTSDWAKCFDQGKDLLEAKHENSINRITAKANPRPIERVAPGVCFGFEIGFRVFERSEDQTESGAMDRELFESVLLRALVWLEQDYLGGGGSRGNGRIKFMKLGRRIGREMEVQSVSLPEV